jgi:hypothetical protein
MDTIHTSLLARMATISPGVRTHIGGELWQLQIDPDEVDSQILVNECFSLLIDESYELGIEFFCERGALCDNLYHLDLTLLLFEIVYPTPLYRSISENDGFKNWIIATVRDGGGDPDNTTIIDLLEYLAIDYPDENNTFHDTYVFLHDKLRSTPVFDNYVLSILTTDNTPFEAPVDPESIQSYLSHIQEHVTRQLKAIDYLHNAISSIVTRDITTYYDAIQLQYDRLDIYKNNAIAADSLANYIWMFQQQQLSTESSIPIEQALVARFTREFESNTPLYEDYFRLQGQTLSIADIISLILGCLESYSTKDSFVFNIDNTFQRLKDLLPTNDTSLQLFITGTILQLSQEFYP